MYQRQLHKTSIYFLRSENTTHKKIPTYRCKTKENHNLTAREQTNPNWKYCRNRKCDNIHTHILITWQTADAQPGCSGVRWRSGRFPGESGAAEPWGNAPILKKEYQKANFGVWCWGTWAEPVDRLHLLLTWTTLVFSGVPMVKVFLACNNHEQSPMSRADDGVSTAAGCCSLVIFFRNLQCREHPQPLLHPQWQHGLHVPKRFA